MEKNGGLIFIRCDINCPAICRFLFMTFIEKKEIKSYF